MYKLKDVYKTFPSGATEDYKILRAFEMGKQTREKRIAELEATCNKWFEHLKNREEELLNELNNQNAKYNKQIEELEKENAELRKIAEFQQSSNMSRHFENKKLKEGLAVGSTFNKALNSMNKNLEEERDKYRNMVFDKDEQLTKAKELLKRWVELSKPKLEGYPIPPIQEQTEQFLSEVEK